MAYRSEYAEILAEMEAKARPKPSIAERVSRWFNRPATTPDPFTWHDVSELVPVSGDHHE